MQPHSCLHYAQNSKGCRPLASLPFYTYVRGQKCHHYSSSLSSQTLAFKSPSSCHRCHRCSSSRFQLSLSSRRLYTRLWSNGSSLGIHICKFFYPSFAFSINILRVLVWDCLVPCQCPFFGVKLVGKHTLGKTGIEEADGAIVPLVSLSFNA